MGLETGQRWGTSHAARRGWALWAEGTAGVGKAGGGSTAGYPGEVWLRPQVQGCRRHVRDERGGHAELRRPLWGLWLLLRMTGSHWTVLSRGMTYVLKGSLRLLGGEQTAAGGGGGKGRNRKPVSKILYLPDSRKCRSEQGGGSRGGETWSDHRKFTAKRDCRTCLWIGRRLWEKDRSWGLL